MKQPGLGIIMSLLFKRLLKYQMMKNSAKLLINSEFEYSQHLPRYLRYEEYYQFEFRTYVFPF